MRDRPFHQAVHRERCRRQWRDNAGEDDAHCRLPGRRRPIRTTTAKGDPCRIPGGERRRAIELHGGKGRSIAERYAYLDGLRGVAALMISGQIIMLFWPPCRGAGIYRPRPSRNLSCRRRWYSFLGRALAPSFVLSGYVLTVVGGRRVPVLPALIAKRYLRLALRFWQTRSNAAVRTPALLLPGSPWSHPIRNGIVTTLPPDFRSPPSSSLSQLFRIPVVDVLRPSQPYLNPGALWTLHYESRGLAAPLYAVAACL